MASPFVELEVGERLVKVTNPDKVFFRTRGETKLDLVRYYLAVDEGIVRALYERPDAAEAPPGRRRGRGDLPEARAGEAARLDRDRACHLPVRPPRRRALRHRGRSRRVGREPRHPRLSPLALAPPGHRASGRAPDRRRPAARHHLQACEEGLRDRPRGARRARLRRLAEDVRKPRRPRRVPDRAELGVSRSSAAPRSPSRARSSGAPRS